jgi:RHS repeat-associated protein
MDTVQRDPQANVLVETDELGRTTQATAYNAFNEPLATIDASGVETTKSYDGSGNVLSTCQPLVASGVTYSVAAPIKCGDPNSTSATTSYVYNDPAHPAEPTSMTDADGKVWTYQYDTYGDVNYSADPLGNVTTSIYDIDGRKRSEVAPKGNLAACACSAQYTTSWTYFPDNQVHTVTDPLNDVTTSTYDLDGNLYQSADALNPAKTTTYRYNLDSEPIESDRNDGSWQKTGYDGFGNVTGQTSGAAGSSTALTSMSYGYDALNRKVSEQAGTDGLTTSAYDPNTGLLTTMTSPKGVVTTYGYDAGSQLTSLSYSDGTTPNVGYTYDVLGRRQTMTDGTGTSTWSYDSLGRLVSYQNGAGVTVAYHYDLKGQQTSMLYPGQTTAVVTGYDAAGRVSTITDWLGHKTTYNYHDADVANPTTATVPQIEKDLPNGEVEMTTLDQAGRVREIKDTGGSTVNSDLTYSQDADGQLTQARSPISGPTTYGYDAVNRLGSAGSATYSYDAANEITGMVNGTTTTTFGNAGAYQSGGDGELPSRKVVNGSTVLQNVTYSYDLNGNRIGSSDSVSGNASTLTWDAANRLTSYASGPTSATYTYDGDGLRQSKTVGGVTSHETWDVSAGLPLLLSDGTYSYVNGPDGLALEEITGTTVNYLHHDQQGSTVLITGGTATEQARYTYDAYGNLLTNDNPSLVNNILYDGQYQDSESGMLYLRARYYDPAIAQFISRDPAVAQTREPYGYVRDSPLNESDPTGECAPWCVVVIILIISAGVGLQVCGDNLSGCGGNHSEHPEPSPTPGPSPTPSPSASPCSVHVPYACPRVPPPASPAGCNPHTTCLYPAPSPSPSVNEPRPPDPANDPGNSDQIPKPPDPNRDREGDVQMGCDPRASSLF